MFEAVGQGVVKDDQKKTPESRKRKAAEQGPDDANKAIKTEHI